MLSFEVKSSFSLDFSSYPSSIIPSNAQELLYSSKNLSDRHWVVISAWQNNICLALSVAEVYHYNAACEWHSLIVIPTCRQQGIGSALFCYTQAFLLEKEKRWIIAIYYQVENIYAPYLEKILQKEKWSPAPITFIRYFFQSTCFNPTLFQYSCSISSSYELFSWDKLTEEDTKCIYYLIQQKRIPPFLSPLLHAEKIHFPTSIGLRKEGQLIGWCVTHIIDAETLLYHSVFFDKSLQKISQGPYLVLYSIQRQIELGITNAWCEIDPRYLDTAWLNFYRKRLAPWAAIIQTTKTAVYIKK